MAASAVLLVAAAFLAATAYDTFWRRDKAKKQDISRLKKWVLMLNGATTASFFARAVDFVLQRDGLPESIFIHDLSSILLWTTLALTLLSSQKPAVLPYLVATFVAFCLEASALVVFITVRKETTNLNTTQLWLQALTCAILLMLVLVEASAFLGHATVGDESERQSLLSGETDSNQSYDSTSDTDSDSDDDDDDEDEIKQQRHQKLQSEGGLFAYLCSFKVFLPFIIPYDNVVLQIYVSILLACALAQRALNVLHPYQLGIIIDKLANDREIPWKNVVLWIVFEWLATPSIGVEAISDLVQRRVSAWSQQSLNIAAFDKVMSLSMSFHDSKDSGEIIKAIEQAGCLSNLFRTLVLEIAPCLIDIVIAAFYINHLFDVYAMLMVVAIGIAFTFATIFISKFVARFRRQLASKEREQSKVLYETIGNWATVTFFNRRPHERSRLAQVTQKTAAADVRSNDTYCALYGAQEFCTQVGRILVSVYALYRILLGISSVGNFVTLQSYWDAVTFPLFILGHSYRQLTSDLVDAERLLQLFETEVQVKDKTGARPIDVTKGEVEVSNLTFAYEGRPDTLTDLTIHAKPGQTIALVGETGSGKSSTLKLLMRLYDLKSGSISIDGQDISEITQDSLRQSFGFVPQETVLFNTTILENVRYGRLDATDAEVYEACKAACIHDKIISLPKSYHTRVGERGIKMSGGERQRIAIARVLLKDPSIVLLDEATSAMDSGTEAKIQQALKTLMHGRTAFVIAHRLSTVVDADQILVVDKGRIIERGTHDELLRLGGSYVELWSKQSGKQSDTKAVDVDSIESLL